MSDKQVSIEIDVDSSGRGFDAVAEGAEVSANRLDALGRAADRANRDLRQLDRQLLESRAAVAALGVEAARSGDKDAFKNFKDAKKAVSDLNAVRTQVRGYAKDLDALRQREQDAFKQRAQRPPLLPPPSANTQLSGLREALPLGIGKIPPQVLIPSAAALATVLGAALNGAVQVVGAGGLVAAGAVGAYFDSPAVRGAVKDLGSTLKTTFLESTRDLDVPLEIAAMRAKDSFGALGPELRQVFAGVAPDVAKLEQGAVGFVRELLPGLARLATASQPVFAAFAADLPKLGAAITRMFDSLNGNALASKGAVDGLNLAFGAVNLTIEGIGGALGDLSAAFELLGGGLLVKLLQTQAAGQTLKEVLRGITLGPVLGELTQAVDLIQKLRGQGGNNTQWIDPQPISAAAVALDGLSNSARDAGLGAILSKADFAQLQGVIGATAQSTDQLAGAITDRLLSATLGLDQANLGFQESLTNVASALKTNRDALSLHAAAGQADVGAILNSVQANVRQYDAMIAAGSGAEAAASAYAANTGALERQLRASGLTQKSIDGLIGKYRGVPANVATDIELHGVAQAISDLNDTLRAINHLPALKTIRVNTVYTNTYAPGLTSTSAALHHQGAIGGVFGYEQGGVTSYAAGGGYSRSGILRPSNPGTILAGEPQTGGEVFVPRLGIAAARGLALADVAASWHGGHVVAGGQPSNGVSVRVELAAGEGSGSADQAIAGAVMSLVRKGVITLTTTSTGRVAVG